MKTALVVLRRTLTLDLRVNPNSWLKVLRREFLRRSVSDHSLRRIRRQYNAKAEADKTVKELIKQWNCAIFDTSYERLNFCILQKQPNHLSHALEDRFHRFAL